MRQLVITNCDKFLAALESVFPQSELGAFMSLSRSQKEAQLNGLSQLVTGIRLFNRHIGKGGESIESSIFLFLIVAVPEICVSQLKGLVELMDNTTKEAESSVETLAGIFLELTFLAIAEYSFSNPECETSSIILKEYRASLAGYRQLLIYLDALRVLITQY